MSVTEAAQRLGLSRRRVLALIQEGKLSAGLLGTTWAVDLESIERRARLEPGSGRHFSPKRAWGLLFVADGLEVPWLDRVSISKLRAYLRDHRLAMVSARLDKRGTLRSYRAHPADVPRIAAEPGLMLTGGTAALELDLGLSDPGQLDAYGSDAVIDSLEKRYSLRPSTQSNVYLRRLPGLGPHWDPRRVAPTSAMALDLADYSDPRVRELGRTILERY